MGVGKLNLRKISKRAIEYKKDRNDSVPFVILKNGKDAVLNYKWLAEWKGHKVSDMAMDHAGRRTLRWMLSKDFSPRLKKVLQYALEEYC